MFKRSLILLLLLLPASAALHAENWPRWRGPNQDGVAAGQGNPIEWSEDKNILWKVPIPGWGTSTPVVWEERIFLTCEDDGKNALLCVDRAGKRHWLTHFGTSAGNRNRKASGANPSPVTNGEHVYAYYRNGDVACVELGGKMVWQTNLQQKYGNDQLWWDLGTSPVLTKDLVVIAVMHQGPSYVVALDRKTGDVRWKQDRELDAPGEARDSYTTPLVIDEAGRETLVVLGADHLTAYDASNGQEVWRCGGLNPGRRGNFRSIASPVVVENQVIAPYERGGTLTAVRLGGSGDVSKSHVAWTADIEASDVPSPVAYDGRIYLCSDRGTVSCVNGKTGKPLWSEALPRNRYPYSASPVIAGEHLYVTREDGTTFVFQLGDKPKLVATNELRENTYATPVFVDGQAFVRSSEFLFCIGKK